MRHHTWRWRNHHGLEDFSGASLQFRAQQVGLLSLSDFHGLHGFQIPQDVGPFAGTPLCLDPSQEFVLDEKSQETHEDVSHDRRIEVMEDRARIDEGFGVSEESFHRQETFVLERYLFRREIGVRPENEETVVAFLLTDLPLVDRDRPAFDAEKLPIPLVAHE